jgi:hypothetical protein
MMKNEKNEMFKVEQKRIFKQLLYSVLISFQDTTSGS